MARRLIPLLDRVLVEKITAPTKSAGGVLLPESAVQKVCGWVTAAAGVLLLVEVCSCSRDRDAPLPVNRYSSVRTGDVTV
jgi:co-chaperonin GroES (HSP10)